MVKSSKKALAVLLAVACLITFMPAMASQSFAAKKLTVKPAKKTIYVKKSFTLKANQKVKWSASKSSLKVVKLTSKKAKSVKVTGKKAGKAVVTAKVGKQTKKVTITVKKAKKAPVAAEPTFAGIENVQTEYGLATDQNKRTEAVTKADLLKGVTAKAADGTDLTSSINVNISAGTDEYSNIPTNSTAQASVAKSYTVTYSVTDAAGKTATKSIKVIVRNQAPSLTVANITRSFQKEAPSDVEGYLVNAGVKAVDDYETFPADTKATDKTVAAFEGIKDKAGQPIKGQTVKVTKVADSTGAALTTIDDKSVPKKEVVDFSKIDFTKAGTYTITFTATDANGAKDSKTATLTIQQNQAPVIDTTKTIEVAKDLNANEDAVKLAVWKQVVINDAEDGTGVKPNKDATAEKFDGNNVIFKDANGKALKFADFANNKEDFYKKLASVTLNNVKDSDGANAQTATVPVKVVDGLVLTASNQTLNVNASSTGNIDLMKFISATYNGEAYALTGTTTLTTDANTTVTVNGVEKTTVPENTSATYRVVYTVTYNKDGAVVPPETKTITVSVVDKAAVDAVVAKINAISTATHGNYKATVNAAWDAYSKLDPVNQNAIPQSTYKILEDAHKALYPGK